MHAVYSLVRKAARTDVPVLIVGETGTGKDLLAREIHERSSRQHGPFVAVNMGAVSSELIASEIFGHVKGAFTGAAASKRGRFEEAHGGTLFLDEITTMDERAQVILLRVLETGQFRRVGGGHDYSPDVRLLAAMNIAPRTAVLRGLLREDLFHRLEVLRVSLPPLRRRKPDISPLATHFLRAFQGEYGSQVDGISKEAIALLQAFRWPGNVRELKNVIAQAAVMAESGLIREEHLPDRLRESTHAASGPGATSEGLAGPGAMAAARGHGERGGPAAFPPVDGVFLPVGISMDEARRAFVLKTLASCGNNKSRTAQTLGISRKALYQWLGRWGITD